MPEQEQGAAASVWAREQPGSTAGSAAEEHREGIAVPAEPDAKHAPTENASDEQLMLAFCAGEEAGFEALFGRYKGPVFGFFRRRLPDRTRAEELTQECFLALLRSAGRYRPEAAFRTFLYAIALNLLRADRRKSLFRGLWSGTPAEAEPADPHSDTESGVLLRNALGKLEAPDREVLMLRTYEELSYSEIAELLRMPVNTVRSRLFRARGALRELLTSRSPVQQEQAAAVPLSRRAAPGSAQRSSSGKERA